MPSIIDCLTLDRATVDHILDMAEALPPLRPPRAFAVMYFAEPSTRTRMSFGSALAASGIPFDAMGFDETKVCTGESLDDTFRVIQRTADLLVIRHPDANAAHRAASLGLTVISAGCGTVHHPTQALLDAYTIRENRGTLRGLSVAVVGNIHSRSAHSLIELVSKYNPAGLYVVSNSELLDRYQGPGIKTESLYDVPADIDVVYWVRHKALDAGAVVAATGDRILSTDARKHFSADTLFLHPLPRAHEIPLEADYDDRSLYWDQVANAGRVRQACIRHCLGLDEAQDGPSPATTAGSPLHVSRVSQG